MFLNYSSLTYSELILAFQPQFGTSEAESEHFRWEKEKRHFNEWFSRLSRPFIFWLSCCRSISEARNLKQFMFLRQQLM